MEMPKRPTAPTTQPEPARHPLPAPAAVGRPPPASSQLEMAAQPGGLDGYLPRPLLTQAPVLRAPIEIPPPSHIEGKPPNGQRYVGELSLFIDENGEVRHIAIDTAPLPPELEQAVRKSFLAARFMPGVRNGKIVKSRLRVEIVFDTPAEPPAAED